MKTKLGISGRRLKNHAGFIFFWWKGGLPVLTGDVTRQRSAPTARMFSEWMRLLLTVDAYGMIRSDDIGKGLIEIEGINRTRLANTELTVTP